MRHIFSNRLQITPISCIVADGKAQDFAFPASTDAQFHIAIRCTVTEACRWAGFGVRERETTRPELCAQDRSEAAKSCLGESQSLRIEPREDRKRARKQRFCFQSASQKNCCQRRILRRKDECVGRALPVAFGTCAPFFLTRKAAFFCFYRDPPAILKNGGFSFLQKPSALPVSAPTLYIRGSR